VRAWLGQMDRLADDLSAVAEDQVRPPADRDLGRATATHLGAEASSGLTALLAFARRGLGRHAGMRKRAISGA
jgi:hypothetical protein